MVLSACELILNYTLHHGSLPKKYKLCLSSDRIISTYFVILKEVKRRRNGSSKGESVCDPSPS